MLTLTGSLSRDPSKCGLLSVEHDVPADNAITLTSTAIPDLSNHMDIDSEVKTEAEEKKSEVLKGKKRKSKKDDDVHEELREGGGDGEDFEDVKVPKKKKKIKVEDKVQVKVEIKEEDIAEVDQDDAITAVPSKKIKKKKVNKE